MNLFAIWITYTVEYLFMCFAHVLVDGLFSFYHWVLRALYIIEILVFFRYVIWKYLLLLRNLSIACYFTQDYCPQFYLCRWICFVLLLYHSNIVLYFAVSLYYWWTLLIVLLSQAMLPRAFLMCPLLHLYKFSKV